MDMIDSASLRPVLSGFLSWYRLVWGGSYSTDVLALLQSSPSRHGWSGAVTGREGMTQG